MKCASVCLSHTTQEKRQLAYHDLCMITSRLLQCRAPKPSFVPLMLPLLSLFSSKTIFTSIIYILCSVMWKNNELFFRFRCSLLIWCLLNTHAAPSFDVQSSGACVDLLANLPLHCLFRFLVRSFAHPLARCLYLMLYSLYNCWFHSSSFLHFSGKHHLFYWFWYMDDDRHKQFIIQLNLCSIQLWFSRFTPSLNPHQMCEPFEKWNTYTNKSL